MQLMQELSAQTAKCERLAVGSKYLRNEIVNLKAERDEALAEIAHSSRIKVKPQPKVVKAWR
jgi:cell division protein FtsB